MPQKIHRRHPKNCQHEQGEDNGAWTGEGNHLGCQCSMRMQGLARYSDPVMLLIPLRTPTLKKGDDLADLLIEEEQIEQGDIVVISSKAVATVEGAMIDLRGMIPSPEADALSNRMHRSPQFCEAMLRELERLHGTVLGAVPGAALTELCPKGLATGRIVVASAGLDESNAPQGFAIGWPKDPVKSVRTLRKELEQRMEGTDGTEETEGTEGMINEEPRSRRSRRSLRPPLVAVILSDSTCMPRRHGVTAFALTVSGLDPLQNTEHADLFQKPLLITTEAVADQLCTAANFLMGNGAQSIPAVIIRDHGLTLSDWEGWVPGIEPERDLFQELL